MKNINNFTGILLVFILIISCQNQTDEKSEYEFHKIEENVAKIISRTDSVRAFNMASLTPFEWTELYIFRPYTPTEQINKDLGFVWDQAEKTFINQEEDFNLLVFTANNKVVNYIKWPINMGDFMKVKTLKYLHDSANFIFINERYGGRVKLFINQNDND